MLKPEILVEFLKNKNISFFTGVPDSLLKEFCAYLDDEFSSSNHIIGANEGASIGLAIGHHLSSGKVPLVYLQNSGLGNTINPLISLASQEVYSIPIILLIGWRGEPGVKDEPQHIHQGRITPSLLKVMEIPYVIIDSSMDQAEILNLIENQIKNCKLLNKPVCVLVRKGTFESYKKKTNLLENSQFELEREEAVKIATQLCELNSVIVCTTGMLSRELFEFRANNKLGHGKDFLCVGGMGHASQIATGIAIDQPDRPVYCFDGDGAALMHMGSMAITGTRNLSNLIHLVFNNGCHESVGGQPTVAQKFKLSQVASALGYKFSETVSTKENLKKIIIKAQLNKNSTFIEILVRSGHRSNIGRPTTTPIQNKIALMNSLNQEI
jgi:phosphonopyruvate decarboxylase